MMAQAYYFLFQSSKKRQAQIPQLYSPPYSLQAQNCWYVPSEVSYLNLKSCLNIQPQQMNKYNQFLYNPYKKTIYNFIIMNISQLKRQNPQKQPFPSLSTNLLQNTPTLRLNHFKKDSNTISNYYNTPTTHKRNSSHRQFKNNNKMMLVESQLPDIQNKRTMKRGSFLEMWLDEALDPSQPKQLGDQNVVEIESTGALRTLQRYEIDKQYLKSQNVMPEVIDKLYHTLYVYTHGLKQTFQQVINFSKSPQNGQSKIINNFWRAFIKLLQGCTSFQTTFQIVQQNYKRYLLQIKQNFKKKQKQASQTQQSLQSQIDKLHKKINEQSYKYNKLMGEYRICENTLELTDQAFNTQVQMRLKFEEKVNSMFTAYEEIRIKYEKLVESLNIKNGEEIQSKSTQVRLKRDLENTIIIKEDLMRQLARYEQVIKEKEIEVELKRQEITEAHGRITTLQQQKQYEAEKWQELISQSTDFKQKSQAFVNEIRIKDSLLKECQVKYKEKERMIDALRMSNESIFEKHQKESQIRALLEGEKIRHLFTISEVQKQNKIIQERYEEIKKVNEKLALQLQVTKNKLIIAEEEIKIQKKCVVKNTELIASLQTVKNKYQKLYLLNFTQKKIVQDRMNEALCSKDVISEQFEGMKMLLENRTKQIEEGYVKLENERELFRKKIQGLKDQIQNKQTQILTAYQKNVQEKQATSDQLKQFSKMKQDNIKYIQDKLKMQAQNFFLRQREEQLSKQRLHNRNVLETLNNQIEELSKVNNMMGLTLSQKVNIINVSKGESNLQNGQLRDLIVLYREEREKKANFVHPMLYEDQREQINRNTLLIIQLKSQKQAFLLQIQQLKASLSNAQDNILQLQKALLSSKQDNVKYQQKILQYEQTQAQKMKLREEATRILNTKIITLGQQITKAKYIQRQKEDEINGLKIQLKQQKMVITKQESDIVRYKKGLNQVIQEMEDKNVEISQLKEEISHKRHDSKSGHRHTPAIKKTSSRQSDRNSSNLLQTEKSRLSQIKEEIEIKAKHHSKDAAMNTQIIIFEHSQMQTEQPFSHKNKFSMVVSSHGSEPKEYACQVDRESDEKDELERLNFQPLRPSREQHKEYKKIEGSQFKRALKITYMRR